MLTYDLTHVHNTNTHTHIHTKMHIVTETQIHIHINQYSDTFLHTWIHKHTLRIIISLPCCHWLILQETNELQRWSEQWEKKTKTTDNYTTITLACSIHFKKNFFSEDTILISTNWQESQHRLTWNELRAVNTTTKLIMMMIVIKMMATKRDNQTTLFLLCLHWTTLADQPHPLTTPY